MVAPLKEIASQKPMKTWEPFGSPLSGQFINGSPKPTSQGEVQTSDVMQMSEGDALVRKKTSCYYCSTSEMSYYEL
jgi:hypothetical protein